MQRILVVEDSPEDQLIAAEALGFGYRIVNATSVDEAAKLLSTEEFDLVLLDLTLPNREGYELIARAHADPKTAEIPMICVTGRTSVMDKVAAFSLGADDYVVKPYNLIELKARIEARLKKAKRRSERDALIVEGPIQISRDTHQVLISGETGRRELDLTPIEFKLLVHLVKSPGRVYTREQLLIAGRGSDSVVFERAVDVHVCSLRKKLGAEAALIAAVPGVGYKFTTGKRATRAATV
ncbi:MAG: response regulator transcription factor [Bdellovibrionales bacterium]|nr:response regulator transcription factor [Bdellovibrionales bacterium]